MQILAAPGSTMIINPDCTNQGNIGMSTQIQNNGVWSFVGVSVRQYYPYNNNPTIYSAIRFNLDLTGNYIFHHHP